MRPYRYLIAAMLAAPGMLHAQYFQVNTWAGSGITGLLNGPAASARFSTPYGVCRDPGTGAIYVADASNHCIRKILGGTVTTLAGNGTAGNVDGTGAAARFNFPTGLDFKGGIIYVADYGNNKIRKVDLGGNVTTLAGSGAMGSADGPNLTATFANPTDVRIDPSTGVVYVADLGNHTIRKVQAGVVITLAGLAGSAGDVLGTGSVARFNRPAGIAISSTGDLYVADRDNNKIKKVTPGGTVTLFAGSGVAATVNGVGAAAAFNRPTYLAWVGTILVVSEQVGQYIRQVTTGASATILTGTGVPGFLDGPIATARFNAPEGICGVPGNIFVADAANQRIRHITVAP